MKMPSQFFLLFLFCFVFECALGLDNLSRRGQKKCVAAYGSQTSPGISCDDISKQRCNDANDGVYWIKIAWTMVYKLIAGVSGLPAKIWRTPFSFYEYSLGALNTKNHFKHHYKNRLVKSWSSFNPSEVRVVLYKGGKEEIVLRFKAANSDNENWFSAANILESPWQDILTETRNYFTLAGPCWTTHCRDFHINHAYGGCPGDDGWLSIGGATCKWETRFPHGIKLIYSKLATHVNYNVFSKVDAADVFAVFLR